jgi:Flp pilus assembly pilin Flp
MSPLIDAIALLWGDDAGVTSVEYALMIAVLSLASVVAFAGVSTEVQTIVNTTGEHMSESSGVGCSTG